MARLQHLKPVDGVGVVIAGAAGAPLYDSEPEHPRAVFARAVPGFAVVEVTASAIEVSFIDSAGQRIYASTVASRTRRH